MKINELKKCLEELEKQGKGDLSVMTTVKLQDLEGGTSLDIMPVSIAHISHVGKTPWSKETEVLVLNLGQLGLVGM